MNNRPHTVVGVLPAVPHYPNEVDVYMPTSACPFRSAAERQHRAESARVRRPAGVRPAQAGTHAARRRRTEVATVAQRWTQDFPQVYRPALGFQARTANVLEQLTPGRARDAAHPARDDRPRAADRLRERRQPDAGADAAARSRAGDAHRARRRPLAPGASAADREHAARRRRRHRRSAVRVVHCRHADARSSAGSRRGPARSPSILASWSFTLVVSVVTGLVFGTFPALASRVDLVSALQARAARARATPAAGAGLQGVLIVAQVAVSVVLLVGAGLLLLSFYRLQSVDPGFNGDRVMSAEVFGNFTKYPDAQSQRRLYVSLLERLESTPGVVSAAVTNGVPLAGTAARADALPDPGQDLQRAGGSTDGRRPRRQHEVLRHARHPAPARARRSPSSITRMRAPVALDQRIDDSPFRRARTRSAAKSPSTTARTGSRSSASSATSRTFGLDTRRRRADLSAAAAGGRAGRPRAGPDDRRSARGDGDHSRRRARHRSGSADRERPHARRDPRYARSRRRS